MTMLLFKIQILLIIITIYSTIQENGGDDSNYHELICKDTNESGEVHWPNTDHGKCSVSQPLCLNENLVPKKRCCVNEFQQFEPAPTCEFIQEEIKSPCPPNLDYNPVLNLCIQLITNTTYPPKCPFEETVPFFQYMKYLSQVAANLPIWMPVEREIGPYGFGLLHWVEASINYKNVFHLNPDCLTPTDCENYYYEGKITENNCVLFYNSSYVRLSRCDEYHTGICAYEPLNTRQKSYCSQLSNSCKQSDYSSQSPCFCKKNSGNYGNLAEFFNPYQNLLYSDLKSNQTCYIALKASESTYMWSNSKLPLSYTYWSKEETFDYNFQNGAMTSEGWVLLQNLSHATNCRIYSVQCVEEENDLYLSYNSTGTFTITTSNPKKWLQDQSNRPMIYCFTDASPALLLSRIQQQNVVDDGSNNFTFSFDAHVKGPGNYWCEGFLYPRVEPSKSNSVLFRNQEAFPGEYVALLTKTFIHLTNPLTSLALDSLETLLVLSLHKDEFQPRIFAIQNVDEDNNLFSFTIHLSSTNSNNTFEEYVSLKELLQVRLSGLQNFAEFTMLEFLSVDYCYKVSSNDSGVTLTWPTTKGNSITLPIEGWCITKDGKLLTRYCSESFVNGARWSIIEDGHCKIYEATEITEQLSSISTSRYISSNDFAQVVQFSESYTKLQSYDIFLISKILEWLSSHEEVKVDLNLTAQLMDNLVKVPEDILEESQSYLNATAHLLFHFNKIITTNSQNEESYLLSKLFLLPAIGNDGNLLRGVFLRNLEQGTVVETVTGEFNITNVLLGENYDSGLVISEELLNQLQTAPSVSLSKIVVHFSNALFNDGLEDEYYSTKIFQFAINNSSDDFQGPISIFYNASLYSVNLDDSCASYELNDDGEVVKGFWTETSNINHLSSLIQCDFCKSSYFTVRLRNSSVNITASLENILDSDVVIKVKLIHVKEITYTPSDLEAVDIYLISKIFNETAKSNDDYTDETTKVVSNLMKVPKSIMATSQVQYMATDQILYYVNEIAKRSNDHLEFSSEDFDLIVLKTDSKVIGFILDNNQNIREIMDTQNFTNEENIDSAIVFGEVLFQQLLQLKTKAIITIYSNNTFFNEDIVEERSTGKILGLSLPNFDETFQGPILIYYNTTIYKNIDSCVYWYYEPNQEVNDFVRGSWNIEETTPNNQEPLAECKFYVQSYFTVLLNEQFNNNTKNNITSDLEDILHSNLTVAEKLSEATKAIDCYLKLQPYDIYLISEILKEAASSNEQTLEAVSIVISGLMKVPKETMMQSQESYSATDKILYYIDEITKKSNISEDLTNENFKVVIVDLLNSQMVGLSLENCYKTCEVTFLYEDYNLTALESNEKLDAAIFFSQELLLQLQKAAQEEGFVPKIIVTVHLNNALFNEYSKSSSRNVSKIFGVILPGFTQKLTGNINIVYNTKNINGDGCAFWNYQVCEDIDGTKGSWEKDSEKTTHKTLSVCNFDHVTHFALLLSNNGDFFDDSNAYHLLDIITNINCVLSLIGLLGILVTGALFEKWRQNTGNQILMNFAVAISIKLCMLYVSDTVFERKLGSLFCTICGAILHYSILSEFCWMLIIAILQFKRFVEVLGGPPKYVLLKACTCGWIFPIFPVLCILIIDRDNYSQGNVGLCYPSDLGLYLGIWLPLAIIITINVVIFLYIMVNVCHKKTETRETVNHEMLFQWRLALLLFSMLGLTWTFGFLAQIDSEGVYVFVYIFCFTATLQGFVMFLFFIVFNKSTRCLYSQSFNLWLYSKNLKKI